jgi:hypothetical protein
MDDDEEEGDAAICVVNGVCANSLAKDGFEMDALIELGRKPALFVFNRFTCLFSLS